MRLQVPLRDEALAAVGKAADKRSFTCLGYEISTQSQSHYSIIFSRKDDTYMDSKVRLKIARLLKAA